ncbi:MAG: carboxypeptidase-like regulatory domain-containing protein [Melioribacteraceae bacterium]|nr:carboxypeptidase-like regulatory domain-containing protein [Melioribacteraceae bacterium]
MNLQKTIYILLLITCPLWTQSPPHTTDQISGDSIARNEYWGRYNFLDMNVEYSFENVTVKEAIEYLSDKYKIDFVYDSKLLDFGNVNVSDENKPLKEILNELLEGTDIGFVSLSNKIVIANKQSINDRTGGIKGTVKTITGEPLISANILIVENNFGCATNENGNYVLKNLKPGTYTLSVTYIGYETQTQKVDVYSGRTYGS